MLKVFVKPVLFPFLPAQSFNPREIPPAGDLTELIRTFSLYDKVTRRGSRKETRVMAIGHPCRFKLYLIFFGRKAKLEGMPFDGIEVARQPGNIPSVFAHLACIDQASILCSDKGKAEGGIKKDLFGDLHLKTNG